MRYCGSVGIEQRRHPRHNVRLAVRYANAEQFVTDYVENLSLGGLYLAGAQTLPLFTEMDVQIELPGQGTWTVRAKSVFIVDAAAAKTTGRTAGAGMEILDKPPGFDDALLGYLLRLGQRRDHTIMVGAVPGVRLIEDAGYRVIPLEPAQAAAALAVDPLVKLIGVLVRPELLGEYRDALGSEIVYAVQSAEQIADFLAKIDSLL
jgi:hypothetical protein